MTNYLTVTTDLINWLTCIAVHIGYKNCRLNTICKNYITDKGKSSFLSSLGLLFPKKELYSGGRVKTNQKVWRKVSKISHDIGATFLRMIVFWKQSFEYEYYLLFIAWWSLWDLHQHLKLTQIYGEPRLEFSEWSKFLICHAGLEHIHVIRTIGLKKNWIDHKHNISPSNSNVQSKIVQQILRARSIFKTSR